MTTIQTNENGFRLKGIWWTEETFTAALHEVFHLHRLVSNRRVAFHFGITDKALRDLRKQLPAADRLFNQFGGRTEGKPARFSGRVVTRESTYDVPEGEAGHILLMAEKERERQWAQRKQDRQRERAAPRKRVQRHNQVQSCRLAGMTQAETGRELGVSLSTVKRYWPEALPARPQRRKRARVSQRPEDKLLRKPLRRYAAGEITAVSVALLMEVEGYKIPPTLTSLVMEELGVTEI
ncbi:hypothetical protein [Enterobacter mori]|uniref:hypothetical protein n=1 Tax=Enterobacter mori TaxID=539813 RepID=UPI003B841ECE